MAHIYNLLHVSLDLFDGAAAPAGGDVGGAGTGDTQAQPLTTHKGNSGEKQVVLYGKQSQGDPQTSSAAGDDKQTQTKVTSDALEERKRRFNDIINGEFKDLDTERMQELFNRRFKEVKALEETSSAQKPIIDLMLQKYGVNDVSALFKAIDEDDSFFEAEAEDKGMTVQQYKEFQRLQRENSVFREQKAQEMQQQQAQSQVQTWVQDAEALKATAGYEDFDLAAEINNPRFLGLLKSQIPVKDAYDVIHLNDIKQSVATQTAQQTQKAVTDNIRARGARPSENGVNSQSGIVIKNDVSKFDKHDRDEIARRALRGEKIIL